LNEENTIIFFGYGKLAMERDGAVDIGSFFLVQADVILRVTTSCICGSDLHMYMGAMPGMKSGDVVGHEFMGVVEAVGPEVKDIKEGQ